MKTRPISAALAATLVAATMLLTAAPADADAVLRSHLDATANPGLASGFSSCVAGDNLKRTGDLRTESWWGYDSSWNRYAYVENNPLTRIDPTGETFWDVLDIGFFAASVGNLWKKALTGMPITAGDNLQVAGDAMGLLPVVPAIGTGGRLAKEGAELGIDAMRGADNAGDLARASDEGVDLVTEAGTVLPANRDYNLVSSVEEGGGWFQIHGTHPHGGAQPHTHLPEVHSGPTGSSTNRATRPTTSADIDQADALLRSGEMRQRQSRSDRGGS